MAFTTTATGSTGVVSQTYNIDWSVGQLGPNAKADVMLVQALLKIFYYELLGFNDGLDPPPGESAVIKVDGIKGPITQRHITHFQRQMAARGKTMVQDGIFDPFRESGQKSTITKSSYALQLLNNGCWFLCGKEGVNYYDNLPNREDMPLELRSSLKVVKKKANKYLYQ